MTWTPERIITLKKLWTLGESAAAIAATLGGVSKNAVIGKARRLSLPAHDFNARPRSHATTLTRSHADELTRSHATAPTRSHVRQKAHLPADTLSCSRANTLTRPPDNALTRQRAHTVPDLAPAPAQNTTCRDIGPHQCRWPEGDPKKPGFHFCGRSTLADKPYCPHHYARAYKTAKQKKPIN